MDNYATKLTALGPDRTEIFLEVDDDELVEEGEIVAGVPAVPDSQEDQGAQLADVSVVHELQSLVDIVHHLEYHLYRILITIIYIIDPFRAWKQTILLL